MESVLADLQEYTRTLDSELLELINKDYADFVNLSSNLVGLDKVLNDLRKPLFSFKDEILVIMRNRVVTNRKFEEVWKKILHYLKLS